ncbi:DUF11 domain-containing protein [Streptomyces sp. NPDC048606]|uniref:DUF11 domain-containing protein n=1 Tax=Streptomyces sp. NPDC048606 TaxID=3154726 RepID=UPI003416C9A3
MPRALCAATASVFLTVTPAAASAPTDPGPRTTAEPATGPDTRPDARPDVGPDRADPAVSDPLAPAAPSPSASSAPPDGGDRAPDPGRPAPSPTPTPTPSLLPDRDTGPRTGQGVGPGADLAVSAGVRARPAAPERERHDGGALAATETYDYLVTVTNHGPSTARQITVTDRLPAALDFLSSRDGCTAAGRTVTCGPLPTLAVGASHTWVLTVRLAPGYRGEGDDIVNEATVDALTPDPHTGNNSTSLTGLVLPPSARLADLSLRKTALLAKGREDVRPGEKFTYLISVHNAGPATARAVEVFDRLPATLTLLSSPDDCALAPSGERLVVCPALDRLAPGATAEFRITVRAAPRDRANPPRGRCTPIENVARVSSAVRDPDPSDNANAPDTTGPNGGRLCLVSDGGKDHHGDHDHPARPDHHDGHHGKGDHGNGDHGRPGRDDGKDHHPGRGDLADSGARVPAWLGWASAALLTCGAALRVAARRRPRR